MRLTSELIRNSLSYTNPLKERELDLRDNDIPTLGNFPLSPRLLTLLCARNRIATISESLANSTPNINTLVLTSNNLKDLQDLAPLKGLTQLVHLSLMDNPVTGKENYRHWIVWLCPKIRFLDFRKVKDVERSKAKQLFGSTAAPTKLANSILSTHPSKSTTFALGSATANGSAKREQDVKMSESERARVKALIQNAKSLDEVRRLETMLNEGRLPPGVLDGDAMDET